MQFTYLCFYGLMVVISSVQRVDRSCRYLCFLWSYGRYLLRSTCRSVLSLFMFLWSYGRFLLRSTCGLVLSLFMFACIHICGVFISFQSYIVDMDNNKVPTVPPPSYEDVS